MQYKKPKKLMRNWLWLLLQSYGVREIFKGLIKGNLFFLLSSLHIIN